MAEPTVKNIKEAMRCLRPHDKISRVLSNKFCTAYRAFEDGTFDTHVTYFGLNNGIVSSYPRNPKFVELWPNIENQMWCMNGNSSGAKLRWVLYHVDNRKYKRDCKKLSKLLKN